MAKKTLVAKAQKELKSLEKALTKKVREFRTTDWKKLEAKWVAESLAEIKKEAHDDMLDAKDELEWEIEELQADIKKAKKHLAIAVLETTCK